MTQTTLRQATESDAHAIAVVHVLSWQKIYRTHIPNHVLDMLSITERENKWRDLLSQHVKVFVLEQNQQIVGFASICASRDKDPMAMNCGEISAIYLHPSVWYQGLGKKLCLAALEELKRMGFSEVILWVLKENSQARNFYKKIGFKETGDFKVEKFTDNVLLNEIRYIYSNVIS